MVYISKVYTRFGDEGQTMLASGGTTSKASLRVCAYGEVDELNAMVGHFRLELCRAEAPDGAKAFCRELDEKLARIQQELFNLGSELATEAADESTKVRVHPRHVAALEAEIDAYNATLAPLTSFVLPGGGPAGVAAHLCRTVCRRAERSVVALAEHEPLRAPPRIYLNRLSDLFFVLGRACAQAFEVPEVLWDSKRT